MEKIAAVVVTYNRKNLLKECLTSLINQSFKLDLIIVIDNNSSDGTAEMIGADFNSARIKYQRNDKNSGSSGGQYSGLKTAYESGFAWIWCMDDDTVPDRDALEKLIAAKNNLSTQAIKIGYLGSTVYFTDGQEHAMNVPEPRTLRQGYSYFHFFKTDNPVLLIDSCSFVSILFSRNFVAECGLPVKNLFIWLDDVEYTSRGREQNFFNFLVLDSRVVHKTKENRSVSLDQDAPENVGKYYYYARNGFFIYKRKNCLKAALFCFRNLKLILKRKNQRWLFLKIFLKGLAAGLFFRPEK
jgi:GT2 family glycosyltransferase